MCNNGETVSYRFVPKICFTVFLLVVGARIPFRKKVLHAKKRNFFYFNLGKFRIFFIFILRKCSFCCQHRNYVFTEPAARSKWYSSLLYATFHLENLDLAHCPSEITCALFLCLQICNVFTVAISSNVFLPLLHQIIIRMKVYQTHNLELVCPSQIMIFIQCRLSITFLVRMGLWSLFWFT